MARICPVCQSADTGGSFHSRDYTTRGRLDIDNWYCHDCQSRWEIHDFIREEVTENHNIRLKDGREWTPGRGVQGDAPLCPYCQAAQVQFVQSDGRWHRGGANVLRYTCERCGAIWQWYVDDEGKTLFKRLWRRGYQS